MRFNYLYALVSPKQPQKILMKQLISFSLLFLLLSSCSGYEEGQWMSFRSKEERIANTWYVVIALDAQEEDISSLFNRQFFTFTKDGQVEIAFPQKGIPPIQGRWFFSDKKKTFHWELDADEAQLAEAEFACQAEQSFKILRLEEKELWLKDEEGKTLLLVEKK